MKAKKILFVTYGGGHVNMILSVVKLLMQRNDIEVDILALTTARKVLEQEGISCFSCRDLPISDGALEYGEQLLKQMQGGHPDIPNAESIAYLGLSFECLVQEYGEKKAGDLFEQKGRQSFLPVGLMEKVICDGGYNMVVATNSPRMERATVIASGNLDVPSLCLVDLFALQGVAWIGKKGYANKVCVLADPVKQILCDAGRLESEVIVTGNPAFDRLADPSIKDKGNLLRKNKGWANKKVILWCSQNEPARHPFTGEEGNTNLPLMIEEKLKNICDKHDDEGWHLFVRPHPSEDLSSRSFVGGVEYGRKEELATLLTAVDVVVVTSSTVGLEALLLNNPLISLNMSIFSKDMPFSDMGMSFGVDCISHLESALESVMSKKSKFAVGLPEVGCATQNVVREICNLMDSKGEVGA